MSINEQCIRDKITQLRIGRGLSEYQLSYQLGHSRGYINNITSGKALPSMTEFLSICEFFNITPSDFFGSEKANPELLSKAINEIREFDDEDLLLLLTVLKRLKQRNNT